MLEPLVTVTVHVPFFELSTVDVAVIVAVPAATPVTTPLDETVAIEVLLDDQLTVCAAPPETLTVAVNVPVLTILFIIGYSIYLIDACCPD